MKSLKTMLIEGIKLSWIVLIFLTLPLLTIGGCEKELTEDNPSTDKTEFSAVPGTVIVHSSTSSGIYRGTPSIVKLPNGHIITSNDVFGTGVSNRTDIFASIDGG